MFTNRLFYLFVVMAVLVVTACAPQVAAVPTKQPTAVRTLPSPTLPALKVLT
jgi:hypothetical protein